MINEQLYTIELYSRQDVYVADITMIIKSFNYSMERNRAESLDLEIDLRAFEEVCKTLGVMPMVALNPYQTDIKIKRGNDYLFRVRVIDVSVSLSEEDASIQIHGVGYLDLLSNRYVTKDYTNQWDTDIVEDLITTTQSDTNGDLGITFGNHARLIKRDRSYERQNVKDAITNLTELIDGNFDVVIDHDKILSTYSMQGSDRTHEVQFIYPGNIRSVSIPRTGVNLFNRVIGIGSGDGNDQVRSVQDDNTSQLNFGLHEEIRNWNSTLTQQTLDDNARARLKKVSNMLEIPQINVSGKDFDLSSYGIGDRVFVNIKDFNFLNTINGNYRIERIDVSIDENQAEDIKLYFDNNQIGGL